MLYRRLINEHSLYKSPCLMPVSVYPVTVSGGISGIQGPLQRVKRSPSRPVELPAPAGTVTRMSPPQGAVVVKRCICLLTLYLTLCATALSVHAEEEAVAANDDTALLAAAKQANVYYQHTRSRLLSELAEGNEEERIRAISLLSRLQEDKLIPVLLPYIDFNKHSDAVVSAACRGLARLGAIHHTDELTRITKHHLASEDVKKSAWNALGRLKELKRVHYTDQSAEYDDAVRASGITNLGTIQAEQAGPILANAVVNDSRAHIRRMAALGLGKLADPAYAEQLLIALTDGDVQVRRFAANALAKMDHKPAIPYLLIQLESNIAGKHLNNALMIISGQDFGYHHEATLTARRTAIQKGFEWYTREKKSWD